MSETQTLGKFDEVIPYLGEELRRVETHSGTLLHYDKNFMVRIGKKIKELVAADVEEDLKYAKEFFEKKGLKMVFLVDATALGGASQKAMRAWSGGSDRFIRQSIVYFTRNSKINVFLDWVISILDHVPLVNMNIAMSSEIDQIVKEVKKALEFQPAIAALKRLKSPDKDLPIMYILGRGGILTTWEEVAEKVNSLMKDEKGFKVTNEGTVKKRFERSIYPAVETYSSSIINGIVRELAQSSVELPFKYVDVSDQDNLEVHLSTIK